jgi:hypothetical protein
VLIPMAMLLLRRRYLATLVRLGNRPRSTSRHLEHKNYVRTTSAHFPLPAAASSIILILSLIDAVIFAFTHSPVLARKQRPCV